MTTRIAILGPGDEPALARFLAGRPDTTMFLRSNLRAGGLVDAGQRFQGTWAAAFSDGDEIVGAAGLFWNSRLIVEASAELPEIVRAVAAAAPRPVTGILGPHAQVEAARDALGVRDRATQIDAMEDLFTLDLADLVVPPALAQGGELRVRRPSADDIPLLGAWRRAYHLEALHVPDDPDLEAQCRRDVEESSGRGVIFLVEPAAGGPPLAMTGFNATLPDVVQVGGVYTPPELRGRGYARAAVAGSLLDARAAGVGRAILFTGDDNVAARQAYVGIGFRIVGDYAIVIWE